MHERLVAPTPFAWACQRSSGSGGGLSPLAPTTQCLVGFLGRLGTSRLPWRQVGAEFAGADADLAVVACQVDRLQGVLPSEGSRALLEAQRLPCSYVGQPYLVI